MENKNTDTPDEKTNQDTTKKADVKNDGQNPSKKTDQGKKIIPDEKVKEIFNKPSPASKKNNMGWGMK